MQELASLDLPQIDLFDPAFSEDPHAAYAKARQSSWLAKYQFGYILLDQGSMKDFLIVTASALENQIETLLPPGRPKVRHSSDLHRTSSSHWTELNTKRIRELVAPAFTPRAANAHRQLMRERIERAIDEVLPQGYCDFTTVSAKYPITVMCRLIDVSVDDIPLFARWLEPQESPFGQDPAALPVLNDALAHLLAYVERVVQKRKAPGVRPSDILQSLVDISNEGDGLNSEELVLLVALLLAAGYDAAKNQLNLLMKLLIDRPDGRRRLAGDPGRTKPFIEEALHFLNVIGSLHRVTNAEIIYRGVSIPANTLFSIPITFHGRDSEVYNSANDFDADRSPSRHFAFGLRMHICLGQVLARALLEEPVPILVRRLKNPRLAGPIKYRSPMGIWGDASLPIAFESGPVEHGVTGQRSSPNCAASC